MRRVSGLTDEQILAYEARIEAATMAALQQVMNGVADRIASIQVAAVLVAADVEDGEAQPVEPEPDPLPPGQPYVSPDDLATIPPAWQGMVVENLLPIAAEIFYESAGMVYA